MNNLDEIFSRAEEFLNVLDLKLGSYFYDSNTGEPSFLPDVEFEDILFSNAEDVELINIEIRLNEILNQVDREEFPDRFKEIDFKLQIFQTISTFNHYLMEIEEVLEMAPEKKFKEIRAQKIFENLLGIAGIFRSCKNDELREKLFNKLNFYFRNNSENFREFINWQSKCLSIFEAHCDYQRLKTDRIANNYPRQRENDKRFLYLQNFQLELNNIPVFIENVLYLRCLNLDKISLKGCVKKMVNTSTEMYRFCRNNEIYMFQDIDLGMQILRNRRRLRALSRLIDRW